jgi:hypothetical protein
MSDFKNKLPIDGEVNIKWPDKEPEVGIYRGHRIDDANMCAVQVTDGTTVWIDRSILGVLG